MTSSWPLFLLLLLLVKPSPWILSEAPESTATNTATNSNTNIYTNTLAKRHTFPNCLKVLPHPAILTTRALLQP